MTNLPGLARMRRAAGLTQAQLAEKLGVIRETCVRWESGDRSPELAMVKRIATTLGCQVTDLFVADSENQPATAEGVA